MDMYDEKFEVGSQVKVRKHKCGPVDVIGPFVGEVLEDEGETLLIMAPNEVDWLIDKRFVKKVSK